MGAKWVILLSLGMAFGGMQSAMADSDNVRLHTGQGRDSVRLETGARGGDTVRTTVTTTTNGRGWTYFNGGYHFVTTKYGSGLRLKCGHGRFCGCGWGGFWDGGRVWSHSTYRGPALVEVARRVDPALLGLESEPSVPAVPVDEGLAALGNGEWSRAAAVYLERAETQRRKELEETGVETSRTDLRLAALALAGDGQMERAARLMARTYAEDPSLTERELSGQALGVSGVELRRMVTRAVSLAHRSTTEAGRAQAWLLVSVLMHAEGRHDLAREMLQRAESGEGVAPLDEEPGVIEKSTPEVVPEAALGDDADAGVEESGVVEGPGESDPK